MPRSRIMIDGKPAEIDLDRLALHEGLALQRTTGMRVPQMAEGLQAQDMEAMLALVWLIMKFRMGYDEVTLDEIAEGKYVVDLTAVEIVDDQEAPGPTGADATAKTSNSSG
ncbi:hypothetical protein HNP84_007322 [Thermocatellispora tengchongensis]|uniref:Uncharacterized protein n=1 Tax=Thermocatellispora tengchongensis TaxID=1073253 RepID=A0A840PJ35_9ACTN|nr:hypothetical protein [Thermocatellispora tengchongensis]MBB5137570.1 hypothetical protein [Thermocatellispora tengchongensis]